MSDETVNILLFLAQGFEDLEAATVLAVFGWTHYREETDKALVTTCAFHDIVKGRFGMEVRPDILFSQIDPKRYRALVIPGGFHSHGYDEAYDPRIHRLVREIHAHGGYIATMCVGILPVADSGVLNGKKATTYPYSRNRDNAGRLIAGGATADDGPVVIDDRIISCGGPGTAMEVAFLLMDRLIGPQTVRDVRHYMLFRDGEPAMFLSD
ncbi:MAG: DJ-1/PfpI family protein [Syntrophobacteraceae bacterium]|nr:DJ-1/PfpI family protein [Syntrophobacteraceae bacterium]